MALGSIVSRSSANAIFGLSAPAVSLVCVVLINALSWGPSDAEVPIGSLLLGYQAIAVAVGLVALRRTMSPPVPGESGGPWQFGIRELLLATFILAVALSASSVAYRHGESVRLAMAVGLSAACCFAMVAVWYRATRSREV